MKTTEQDFITKDTINKAYTFQEFQDLTRSLFEKGRTTNEDNTEAMLDYTKMTLQRMDRIYRTSKLAEETVERLQHVNRNMLWLVINEGWCGDSGQNLPYLQKMAEASSNIELRIILRDRNLEIMDRYLTNGARSVPKLVALDANTLEELGTWGPRPKAGQEYFLGLKADETISPSERNLELHKWYASDKGTGIQKDILELLEVWDS